MAKIYFTITGLHFRYGDKFFEKDMQVKLEKEPDNKYDKEAIKVTLDGLGAIGYVANSVKTVIGESVSAGRLYDKFDKEAYGKVLYIAEDWVICELIN